MAEYDDTNTFVLFVNDKGDNPKRPDRTGTLNVGGVEYKMSGWIRQGKNGPFLSGQIEPKAAKPAPAAKMASKADDFDSDLPF